jgi:hypothetical protein
VITEWNVIASRTIYTENGLPVPSGPLYFGFVSLAMYDAVVTIEGGYEPYAEQPRRRHARASSEVAAATAAYRVLRHYFPASSAALDADYAASLSDIPNGVGKRHGQRAGVAAAAKMIRLRESDGRNATVPEPGGLDPGQWRRTPDGFAAMTVPWLGFVTPLLGLPEPNPDARTRPNHQRGVRTGRPRGPALRGHEWLDAHTRTDRDGSVLERERRRAVRGGDARSGDPPRARHRRQRRAFAILNATMADGLIACWRAKADHAYWRPVTAIRLADTEATTRPNPTRRGHR